MIRKSLVIATFLLGGFFVFLLAKPAHGADIITDQQIQVIKTNCTDIQATLNRLQQTDLLLRTDRGELYRTVADKLMVPLNQRVASNQLDGGKLVAITASFNTKYSDFYDAYKEYDRALTSASRIDCVKQPTQFYDAVAVARTKRQKLHAANQALVELAAEYQAEFKDFRAQVKKEDK